MKRIFALFLSLSLIMVLSVTAWAEGSTRIYCEESETQSGEYTVQIIGSDIGGLAMIQFELSYDPNLASCIAAEVGEAFAGAAVPTVNAGTPGHILFAWDDIKPLKGDGVLLNLKISVPDGEAAELTFAANDNFVFAYEDYTEADAVLSGCTLRGSTAEEEHEADDKADTGNTESAGGTENTAPPATDKDSDETGTNAGITVSSNRLDMNKGDSRTLATDDADDTLTWTSSNERVAVISEDGTIQAKGSGTAIITVTDSSGAYGTCVVNVEGGETISPVIIVIAAAAAIAICAWLVLKRKKTAAAAE